MAGIGSLGGLRWSSSLQTIYLSRNVAFLPNISCRLGRAIISPTSCGTPERFAKCQVTDDVKGAEIVPVLHIAGGLSAMSVKLADHHVDEMLDHVLLHGQGFGGKIMTKLLSHLTMMLGIADGEEGIGFAWGGFVPVALNEEPFACAGAVDVLPRLRSAERELVGRGPHHGAISVMELLDLEQRTAVKPSRDKPVLLAEYQPADLIACEETRFTGVAAASLGPGKPFKG